MNLVNRHVLLLLHYTRCQLCISSHLTLLLLYYGDCPSLPSPGSLIRRKLAGVQLESHEDSQSVTQDSAPLAVQSAWRKVQGSYSQQPVFRATFGCGRWSWGHAATTTQRRRHRGDRPYNDTNTYPTRIEDAKSEEASGRRRFGVHVVSTLSQGGWPRRERVDKELEAVLCRGIILPNYAHNRVYGGWDRVHWNRFRRSPMAVVE